MFDGVTVSLQGVLKYTHRYISSLCVLENKPKPSMTQQPDVNKVYTGESVSFKCKVELSTGWEYSWYKDGKQLPINSSSFNIRGAHLLNGGTYECMAIRNETMYDTERSDGRILRIFGEPKLLCVDVL